MGAVGNIRLSALSLSTEKSISKNIFESVDFYLSYRNRRIKCFLIKSEVVRVLNKKIKGIGVQNQLS